MNVFKTFCTLLLALPLLAAPAERKWTVGVVGTVNAATSPALKEVTNKKAGLGGGLHATYNLAPRHAVRLRAEYMAWPSSITTYSPIYTVRTKANVTVASVDYLFFVKKSWYVSAGVGESHWQNQYTGRYPAYVGRKNFLETADVYQPAVTAGTGYVLPVKLPYTKSLAVEGRWIATHFGARATGNSVQLGVVASF